VTGGAKIVDENDRSDANFLRKRFGVDDPRQVRSMNAVVDDGTSYAKTGGTNSA